MVNDIFATSITVEWSWEELRKDSDDITDVLIRVMPSDEEYVVSADDASAQISALAPQTDYAVTVYSIRGQQLSLASNTVRIVTPRIKKLADRGDVSRLVVQTWSDDNPKAATEAASADLPVEGVGVAGVHDIGSDSVVLELSSGISDADAAEIVADLESDPRVESVEVDQRVRLTAFPSDPPDDTYWSSGGLWGLYGTYGVGIASGKSSMNNVWTTGQGSGAVVAVLDTGSTVHPDLDSNYVAGYDFVSAGFPSTTGLYGRAGATDSDGDYVDTNTYGALGWDDNPLDPGDWDNSSNSSWHGTHVAGTVAAVGNNAQGVIGVAPQARIQPVRVLTYGGGWTSDIVAGITWASGGTVSGVPANTTPADVINLSLGGEGLCTSTWQTAIDGAVARGSVVVVSAGNGINGTPVDASRIVPANCNNVITVASSTSSGNRSSFSNYGSTVEITAPGSGIMSTLNSGTTTPSSANYGSYSGTSMAAPHVSGVAALLKAADGSRTPSAVLSLLQSTVQSFPTTGSAYQCSTSNCGAGLLTAASAVDTDPAIIGISPSGGPTAGGDTITITGRNLANTTSVTFGGTAATGLTVNSSTSVTVIAPAKTAGSVDIVLTSGGITATSVNGYTYYAAPVLTSLNVASGTLAGGTTVVISGSNLTSTTGVTFGGTAATVTATGASSVTVTTPARSVGTVDVVVTTLGGSDTLASAFEFKAFPVISSYSADQGSVSGGDTITITGSNLADTTGVSFGGVAGSGISATSTSVTVTTPANTPGLADVAVTNSSGTTT
ncbi:MAG TPA: S8 family serine peptidase, partial [Acidimicrobiia bacterium]